MHPCNRDLPNGRALHTVRVVVREGGSDVGDRDCDRLVGVGGAVGHADREAVARLRLEVERGGGGHGDDARAGVDREGVAGVARGDRPCEAVTISAVS